jgi:hypothetical protein
MTPVSIQPDDPSFPYVFSLALSAGCLAVYFAGTLISRLILSPEGKTRRSFNLGLPPTRAPEELFAISLVSAATTLSTVFVAFLNLAGTYGLHVLICPVCFAGGILLAFRTYRRMARHGYMDNSQGSGLLPRFAYAFTGSRTVAVLVILASALPLFAVLVLEMRYGVLVFLYLQEHGHQQVGQGVSMYGFLATLSFLIMLLGYVFVGGFRAVVTSDVWQYRTMKVGFGIVLLSLLYLALNRSLEWQSFRRLNSVPSSGLASFYVTIALIDIFGPLCLALTWQRFYAFQALATNYKRAAYSAVRKVIVVWGSIIGIALLTQALSPWVPAMSTEDNFFRILTFMKDGNGNLGDWFAYFVFPLVIVSALSGMYSSSDTCVSSLLYLTESWVRPNSSIRSDSRPLGQHYFSAMALIFSGCLAMYFIEANNTVDFRSLDMIAINVFGNAVLIAPSVLLMSLCGVAATDSQRRWRKACVAASICAGFGAYWTAQYVGTAHPLRAWTTLIGFTAAVIPAALLMIRESQCRKEDLRAGVPERIDGDAFRESP